jgi:23S rRNA pseudoU1915 N3-methylase RlmH
MNTVLEDCLKVFNIKDTKNILELSLEEREIRKMCEQIQSNEVVVIDAEPVKAEKLAEIVKYLKTKNFKFLVIA